MNHYFCSLFVFWELFDDNFPLVGQIKSRNTQEQLQILKTLSVLLS